MAEFSDAEKSKLCLECRWCCTVFYIPIEKGTNLSLFALRGTKVLFHNLQPFAIIESPCQHLMKNGCDIYENRHVDCRMYDGRKDIFSPERCAWNNG
jgi:hypothetical protein